MSRLTFGVSVASAPFMMLVLLAIPQPASAQVSTPGEIPRPDTYKGSIELERRRQEAAKAPADNTLAEPSPSSLQANAAAAAQVQAASIAAYRAWMRQPAVPPGRNVLLGRWSWANVTRSRGPLDELVEAFAGAGAVNAIGCGVLFGDGTVEFRSDGISTIKQGVESKAPGAWVYRGDGKQMVALKVADVDRGETGYLFQFDFITPDRVRMQGGACEMNRVGAATVAQAATPAVPAVRPATAGASVGREPAAVAVPDGGAAAPPVKSRTYYRCAAETIFVDWCRRDFDKPGSRPRPDAENTCNIYFPDRPKLPDGNLAFSSDLERRLAVKVQGCKAEPAGK